MALDIHIQRSTEPKSTGTITVRLSGSLDTATAPELERQLSTVIPGGAVRDVVFDLAELRFISSAGLRVFGSVRQALKVRGGQVSFIQMQPQIAEVFAIMRSLPGIAVFQNMAELDRYLAARQHAHESGQ